MSLKFLVPLNLLIISIWIVHVAANLRNLEQTLVNTEVEATEQLAFALKIHLESMIRRGEAIAPDSQRLEELSGRWQSLDIMVIDSGFEVCMASNPARIGKRWYERSIETVLSGTAEAVWNVEGHAHEGRRAIDASVGVIGADGQVQYVVHIAKWLDRLLEASRLQRRNAMALSLLELVAVAVAVNLLTLVLVIRPLKRIRRTIHSSGWLGEQSRPSTRDEIGHLSMVISALLEQVQTRTERLRSSLGEREDALQEVSADRDILADAVVQVKDELADAESRLVRAERIAAQAQLSRALAHELRNPLHIIRATAEIAVGKYPEVAELAADIMEEVDRVNGLISKVLAFTRPSDMHKEQIDVEELLSSVRSRVCRGLCRLNPSSCDICIVDVGDEVASIEGDPVLLEQAVMNLFLNAREASSVRAPIALSASMTEAGEVEVVVADRGSGITEEDRARVFEPFYTRKADGVGLGLPTVQRIIDLHDGSIRLEARKGGGTAARITLPHRPMKGGS